MLFVQRDRLTYGTNNVCFKGLWRCLSENDHPLGLENDVQ